MRAVTSAVHRPSSLWRVAQLTGLVLTLFLLAGLVVRPDRSLHILWDMVIPLLPAVFLVNPMLWRNVCPLATLNQFRERTPPIRLPPNALQGGWVVGMLLLFALVPARRVLFNEQGSALAATVALVALLSLGSGFIFSRRAGFCNSLCPVCTACAVRGGVELTCGGT